MILTPANGLRCPSLLLLQVAEPAAASTPDTETEEEMLSPDSGGPGLGRESRLG